jgi:hypothetical protein
MTNIQFSSDDSYRDNSTVSARSTTDDQKSEGNVLESLKKLVQDKVRRGDVHIAIPERPGVMIRVSPNISQNQLKSWRRNAGEERKGGMDTMRFSTNLIAATTTGILVNDEIVTDDNGVELTFASPEIMAMTNTNRPHPDCVLAFFGLEPHVESAAVAIIEAAGYGDNVDALDPTKRSSES